jgi:hypothetical protein
VISLQAPSRDDLVGMAFELLKYPYEPGVVFFVAHSQRRVVEMLLDITDDARRRKYRDESAMYFSSICRRIASKSSSMSLGSSFG